MEKISEILKRVPVNSYKNNLITVNSNKTVNSNNEMVKKINAFLDKENITVEGVALTLAKDLGDQKSIDYYRILAMENPIGKLLEALNIVKETARRGKIKTTKPIFFQWLLKRFGLKTKFKHKI